VKVSRSPRCNTTKCLATEFANAIQKAGIPVLAKGGLEKRSDIYVALNQSLGLKLRGWGRGWLLELKVLKGAASKNASPELWSKTMSKTFEAPFASMKPSQRLKILCDSLEASRSKKGVEQCYELVSTMSPEELSEACIVTAKARTPIFTAKCCLEIADVDLSSAFGGDGSADAKSPSQVRRFRTISVEGGNTNMAVETVINLLKTRGVEDVFIGGYPGFIVHTNKTRKTKASPEQEKSRSKLISELLSLLESQLAKVICRLVYKPNKAHSLFRELIIGNWGLAGITQRHDWLIAKGHISPLRPRGNARQLSWLT